MNWDEAAEDHAVAHHTYENERLLSNEARWKSFVAGARWQREQLLSDEAVERVAARMFTAAQAEYEYWDRSDWDELHKSNQDVYRSDARAAIVALLGEERLTEFGIDDPGYQQRVIGEGEESE